MTQLSIDPNYLTTVLSDLVSIDSTNPSLSPDGAGEAEIAAYVAEACRTMGLVVEILEPQQGRPSVLATKPGTGGGPSLMLNAHLDTVGVTGMQDPFTPIIRDGRLYGRGAQDMKGSLAACLAALHALQSAGVRLRGDLLLAAVADEEYASLGTEAIAGHVRVDAAIVTEPTDLQLCLAHKGFAWIEVQTHGRAAHGSRYWEGLDANRMLGHVLVALDELDADLRIRRRHPLVGPASLHAASMHGGTEPSVYAAQAALTIERRTLPGETPESALAEVQAILDRLSAQDSNFAATARLVFSRPPFEAHTASPLRSALEYGYAQITGNDPTPTGIAFWMDSAILSAAGADTLIIGPTGGGLHSAEEWVDLDSCLTLARLLAETAIRYSGKV